MKIAGLIKASFIDYPGKASAVVFLGGCNFHCGYCHNPEVVRGGQGQIDEEELLDFLKKRRRFLDGVCISGGEPTLQRELVSFAEKLKRLGYLVKLDTNGTNPEVVQELMENRLVDYVAMDFKAPLGRYGEIAGCAVDGRVIAKSRDVLQTGGISHEFRTTVCREQLDMDDLLMMAEELVGAHQWYLQQFHKQGELLDEQGLYSAYSMEEMEKLAKQLRDSKQGRKIGCVSVR